MTHVQGFDSMDEMFGAMNVAEDIANAGLTPGQVALRDDVAATRHWAQPLPDIDLVVYGATPPIADIIARDPGFDVADNRARGYLTGVGFSAFEPTGESSDTHVSQVVPISAEVFEMAKALDWPTWSMLAEGSAEVRPLGYALARAEAEARA